MKERLTLPAILFAAGVTLTAVHDYAYRRGGGVDLELGGLISHAGTDMLIVASVLAFVALLWSYRSPR